MKTKDLENITIVGLGLLGGSLGLAIDRVFPDIRRVGFSHRPATRQQALEAGVVDTVCDSVTEAVGQSQLVILASPIGTFAELLGAMAGVLPPGCVVTDVGSTKVLPVRWGQTILPRRVEYLGSHPMAGSEQRGVDFARADLFDGAHCILTPTRRNQDATVGLLEEFWQALGMRVCRMTPARHDRVLARISHLPHVLAAALIHCSDADEMLLCGKGFLDTTRIASGPASVWRDILLSNADNTQAAIEKLIQELRRVQNILHQSSDKKIIQWLDTAQSKRNDLVEKKLLRKELPT